MRYLAGVDDSDSRLGLCTTFLGFKLVQRLLADGCIISAYPRLVRLNPNIPFKTRGNAAVCIEYESSSVGGDFDTVCSIVERYSDLRNGANTGVVQVSGTPHPYFEELYRRALSGVVNKGGVLGSLRRLGVRVFTRGNGMGVVGAAASIGADLQDDHTYELLAYRTREAWGTPRLLGEESVVRMDRRTHPHTFNNYDYENRRVMVAPHGPDPVLLGIRGDSPAALLRAFSMVRTTEEPEGHMVYVSNQHTDAHVRDPLDMPLKAFSSGWLEGRVLRAETGRGAHVYFQLETEGGAARCAVYEPTGDLQRVARLLAPGDLLRVYGGVRRPSKAHPRLLNVEMVEVLSVARVTSRSNPRCASCGARMKSEGTDKGFQCPSCKSRAPPSARESHPVARRLLPGRYLCSPRSQRHLTKQLVRYGREPDGGVQPPIDGWVRPSPFRPSSGPVRSPRPGPQRLQPLPRP